MPYHPAMDEGKIEDTTVTAGDVTRMLERWRGGDEAALERLVPVVYDELRRLAGRQMAGERVGHTLGATALVHEAFVRLAELDQMKFNDRSHFFAMGSRVMRRVLVDHARRRSAAKRGSDQLHVTLDRVQELIGDEAGLNEPSILDLEEALEALEAVDERACRVVEMRYFGGLTGEEVAAVLDVSLRTVRRDWMFAKAFLRRELQSA